MRAGELRHIVSVQAPVGVLHESEVVEIDGNVRMKIDVLPLQFQGSEAMGLGGVQAQTKYTLTARYRTDISRAYVIRELCCTQRVFQIVAVIPNRQRDELQMTCVTNN